MQLFQGHIVYCGRFTNYPENKEEKWDFLYILPPELTTVNTLICVCFYVFLVGEQLIMLAACYSLAGKCPPTFSVLSANFIHELICR